MGYNKLTNTHICTERINALLTPATTSVQCTNRPIQQYTRCKPFVIQLSKLYCYVYILLLQQSPLANESVVYFISRDNDCNITLIDSLTLTFNLLTVNELVVHYPSDKFGDGVSSGLRFTVMTYTHTHTCT